MSLVAYPRRAMTQVPAGLESSRADASQRLLEGLRAAGRPREAALTELHALLIRGAHHELRRRRDKRAGLRPRRLIEQLVKEIIVDGAVVEHAIASTHDRPTILEGPPRDAEARCEIRVLGTDERIGQSSTKRIALARHHYGLDNASEFDPAAVPTHVIEEELTLSGARR